MRRQILARFSVGSRITTRGMSPADPAERTFVSGTLQFRDRRAGNIGLELESRSAADAVLAHISGTENGSPSVQATSSNLDNGDSAYANLNAIEAAVDIIGSAGAAATVAWGVFTTAGEEYTSGW